MRREVTSLQRDVATLRAMNRPKTVTIDAEEVATREVATREVAKRKRIEEREAAKREHAAFVAKQALLQPEKDRARAEWEAKDASRKRELNRVRTQKWRAANPEKAKAISDRANQKRKEERTARKQIPARPELLGDAP